MDGGETVGDSESIIAHLTRKYDVTLGAALTPVQRATSLLSTCMLDDLYWIMAYSRWKDERYWLAFRAAEEAPHPRCSREEGRTNNAQTGLA